MIFVSTARVPTVHAARYVRQLCSHWAHSLAVEQDENVGRIVFPRDARGADWPGEAIIALTAGEDHVHCRIEASAAGQLEGLKGALARHIDRFAFREAPLPFDWEDAG